MLTCSLKAGEFIAPSNDKIRIKRVPKRTGAYKRRAVDSSQSNPSVDQAVPETNVMPNEGAPAVPQSSELPTTNSENQTDSSDEQSSSEDSSSEGSPTNSPTDDGTPKPKRGTLKGKRGRGKAGRGKKRRVNKVG